MLSMLTTPLLQTTRLVILQCTGQGLPQVPQNKLPGLEARARAVIKILLNTILSLHGV